MTSNGWYILAAEFTVAADYLKPLFSRDLFEQLGIAVTKLLSAKDNESKIATPHCAIKEYVATKFPKLNARIERPKNHTTKSKFHRHTPPRHQEGRRIPTNLQDTVKQETTTLFDEKYITKETNCSDK